MAGRIAYYGGIVRDGLVLNLDTAKADSYPRTGTTWRDISGNQNNGTLTNGPTFDPDNGGNIVFDGVNDFINLSSYVNNSIWNSTFPFGLTIDVVFRLKTPFPSTNDGRTIISRTSGGAGTNTFNFSIQSNLKHRLWINTSPGISSNTTLLVDTIYHTTVIWDRTHVIYYINGILDSISSYAPNPTLSTHNNLTVGNWVPQNGWQFPGKIYYLKFYNRALTAQEVLQNYNATKGRYGL
jgi:hypothetical protein